MGYRIAEARRAKGWNQQEFAERLGTTQQVISRYESGERDPKAGVIAKMSSVLGVTVSYLLGMDEPEITPVPVQTSLPYVGRIAAGTPNEAIEFDGERRWASPDVIDRHPDAFFLRVHGDSMNLLFPDGCLVAVDPDEREIASGKVYAVLVNGFDATLKQVFLAGDTIVLHPVSSNPEHKDRTIDRTDPDAPFFSVIGRAVWYVGPEE